MSWEGRNLFNRRFNLGLNQEDAYVSGYFGVKFLFSSQVAKAIKEAADLTAHINKTWDENTLSKMFSSLTEAVTALPGGTLNVAEIVGQGGVKWGAPTSIDFGDTVTLRMRELSNMPVRKAVTGWTNLVRHTNTGASPLRNEGGINGDYTKSNFSADLLYWTLKPNARDVEFACIMKGVYTTTDLSSQIGTNLTTVDGLAFDVNLHVDTLYWDSVVKAQAQAEVERFHAQGVGDYFGHV
jgi:hypothetical protein